MIIIFKQINQMSGRYNFQHSRRWESPKSNASCIDFDQLFSNPNLNAIQLLNMDNIVEECKRQNDKMTQKLIGHKPILEDLLDICLRPSCPRSLELGKITNEHTYKALEILTNINTEEFSEYLLGITIKQPQEDENVITQEPQQQKVSTSIPLMDKLFILLKDKKPIDETPLWYMYKIGSSLCYQKPKYLLNLFKQNKQIALMVFQHFYSNSILEWLVKLLQIEDSTSFFQAEKIIIFRYLVQSLEKEDENIEIQLDKLGNFQTILVMFLQKMQDRFDKSKYISLSKSIFGQKFSVNFALCRLLTRIQHFSPSPSQAFLDQFIKLIIIAQKYLHFSSNFKPSLISNINNSISYNQNRSQSNIGIGSAGNNGLDASVVMDVVIDAENWASVKLAVQELAKLHSVNKIMIQEGNERVFPISLSMNFLKLLKSVFLVLELSEQALISKIITPQFVRYLLTLIKVHKNFTILHNTIKDILIEAICKNYEHTVPILLDQEACNFLQMVSQIKGKSNSTQLEYQNQVYHIFQTIFRKGEQQINVKFMQESRKSLTGFQELFIKIKEKQKLYATLIGGNPRKESSCWGDSSQDDRLFPFNFNNQPISEKKISNLSNEEVILSPTANDIIEGNTEHWFDCGGLPLDSDESRDQLENQIKSEEVIEVSDGKQGQFNIQSQLVKRFKNIGIVQCEEKQIRIPRKMDRYPNAKKSKSKGKTEPSAQMRNSSKMRLKSEESGKDFRDKQEMELEKEIKILENKRHHRTVEQVFQPGSPQIKFRMKKKVDSLEQQLKLDQPKVEQKQMKMETLDVSGLLDLSNSKDKSRSDNSLQKPEPKPKVEESNPPVSIPQPLIKEVKETPEANKENHEMQTNHFSTYLSYQIEEILSELD